MNDPDVILVADAQSVLSLNNRAMAEFLGISLRTMQRFYKGQAALGGARFAKIAAATYPRNPGLAARAAVLASTTLEALGLVAPKQPPLVATVVPEPPKPPPHPRLADSVVYIAADMLDLVPRAVRPAMLAAFKRAHELGLTVEQIAAALEDAEPAAPHASPLP